MAHFDFANGATPSGSWDAQGTFHANSRRSAEQLAAAQEAESARIAAAVKEGQELRAAAQRARDAAEREAGAAELNVYEQQARAAWLASGGDAAGFARNWPKLRDERLQERARERLTGQERQIAEARAELRARGPLL